jgi:SRSO17 transposase
MTLELNDWADRFAAFQARFAPLFGRREPREAMGQYLRGLLSRVERKNSWQMAEAVGEPLPDRMQRLLYQVDWDADAARDLLQQFITETLGDAEGIGVVDETGFLKQGDRSVGVQRQYCGTAGKIENCQVATLLSYASPKGHTLLDRRLYLPESWCADAQRRARAQVPETVTFQTKPQQAVAMLEHAWEQGVPMRWVTGDEVYGNTVALRQAVSRAGRWYVLAVSRDTPVWTERPPLEGPDPARRGQGRVRLAEGAPRALRVQDVAAAWPERCWQRLAVLEGAKGPRCYDWAAQRIIESHDGLPGPEGWLLARRSISDPMEVAYYLSNAPADQPLVALARVASARYTVEQCIAEAKGETGLDEYEVRLWPSWHRHVTLSLMAQAWLAAMREQAGKKGGPSPSWPG